MFPADEPDLTAILAAVAEGRPRAAWLPGVAARRRDALGDWLVHEGWLTVADPLADAYAVTPKGEQRLARHERASRT